MEPVHLADIPVLYVAVRAGGEAEARAFQELERRLGSPKGRRFYGTFLRGEYRASAEKRPGDSAEALGLAEGVLPGGWYVRRLLEGGVSLIGPTFNAMARDHDYDPTRPEVEHYRREGEIVLMLPVLGVPESRIAAGGRGAARES